MVSLNLSKTRPRKTKRINLGTNLNPTTRIEAPKRVKQDHSINTLDSFLDGIDDSKFSDHLDLQAETANNEPNLLSKLPLKTESKLNKIEVEYSQLPFIKKLYHETESIDGNIYREAHGISIEGEPQFSPVSSWNSAGLPLPILRVIEKCNYRKPTPIQAQSLPILMSGSDFLGTAPTGSGKTAAFIIPLCRHVAVNRANYMAMHHEVENAYSGGPYGIILVPTRELCIQIRKELEGFAQALQLSALGCYGGSDISLQIAQIVKGACNIIVATPGRLIDLLAVNSGRVLSLRAVTYLVIDETDRMFDLGFGPQVRTIISSIRPDHQTVFFSATMSPSMESLVQNVLDNPVKVTVGVKATVPDRVMQQAVLLKPENKFEELVKILKTKVYGAVIVFVNTQVLADSLTLQLLDRGFKCHAIHGGMDQRDRDETINDFKNGELQLLIATSVAARGLDVRRLKTVINYDPATHLEDYIHRAGRTGRADESGECITFLCKEHRRQAHELAQLFEVNPEIQKISDDYKAYSKSTDPEDMKNIGFGGHGLAKLDEKRTLHRSVEKNAYLNEGPNNIADTLDLNEIITKIGNNYSAILPINDIPKEARIALTSIQRQNEIIENFRVSITLKGEFLSNAKLNTPEEKKLHLYIESVERDRVVEAYTELVDIMNKKATAPTTGRYSQF